MAIIYNPHKKKGFFKIPAGATKSPTPAPPSFTNTKSLEFDGVDESVTTNFDMSSSSLPNFTTSFWLKVNSVTNFTSFCPIGIYVTAYANSVIGRIYNTTGLTRVAIQGQGGTTYSSTDLNDGAWHHIVYTVEYDSGGTICNVFVDGTQEITNKLLYSFSPVTGKMCIGARQHPVNGSISWCFAGNVDEVSVFNEILDATTSPSIEDLYNIGAPSDLSSYGNLLGWWRCGDGDTYPTIIDHGSGGNNGTMTNMSASDIVTDAP
tara:strand:+ start:3568 stop:4356 length:789 start_codon:yes stop_codon:yes gene_type:complete